VKRTSTDEPLTPDDVAERLTRAAMRTLRIMLDVRQSPDLYPAVRRSRYLLPDILELLSAELDEWGIKPRVDHTKQTKGQRP
jgi:hypothetical protein